MEPKTPTGRNSRERRPVRPSSAGQAAGGPRLTLAAVVPLDHGSEDRTGVGRGDADLIGP